MGNYKPKTEQRKELSKRFEYIYKKSNENKGIIEDKINSDILNDQINITTGTLKGTYTVEKNMPIGIKLQIQSESKYTSYEVTALKKRIDDHERYVITSIKAIRLTFIHGIKIVKSYEEIDFDYRHESIKSIKTQLSIAYKSKNPIFKNIIREVTENHSTLFTTEGQEFGGDDSKCRKIYYLTNSKSNIHKLKLLNDLSEQKQKQVIDYIKKNPNKSTYNPMRISNSIEKDENYRTL